MRSILLYHNIARRISPFGSTIPPSMFETHLKFLKSKGIRFISLSEYTKGEDGVVITFDDGFEDLYIFLPELVERYRLRPIIFIVSGFLGKTNTWDVWPGTGLKHLNRKQVIEMRKLGIEFGSHSHTHIDFSRAGMERIREEIVTSRRVIEDILGEDIKFFSFPFGRWRREAVDIALDSGYTETFTSVPIKTEQRGISGRWGVYIIDPPEIITMKQKESSFANLEAAKLRIINRFSNGTYFARKVFGLSQ